MEKTDDNSTKCIKISMDGKLETLILSTENKVPVGDIQGIFSIVNESCNYLILIKSLNAYI
jgi:hypothetical protein